MHWVLYDALLLSHLTLTILYISSTIPSYNYEDGGSKRCMPKISQVLDDEYYKIKPFSYFLYYLNLKRKKKWWMSPTTVSLCWSVTFSGNQRNGFQETTFLKDTKESNLQEYKNTKVTR